MLAKHTAIPCFVLALSLICALLPQQAQACSCAVSPIYNSDPADGAENVPVNAAVLISGAFSAGSLRLEEASGAPVTFTFQGGPTPSCAGTSGDLIPKEMLRPNTRYVVKVEPLYPELATRPPSLTFMTGSESLPNEELAQPSASVAVVYDVPPDGQSCGTGNVRASIDVKDWSDVEVIAQRDNDVMLHWMLKAGDGAFKLPAVPDCIEFRRRARTGRRSAPVTFCGDALQAKPYGTPPSIPSNESNDAGAIHDAAIASGDARASEDASVAAASTAADDAAAADGCSSAPGAPTTALPMLIALIAMSLMRRREE